MGTILQICSHDVRDVRDDRDDRDVRDDRDDLYVRVHLCDVYLDGVYFLCFLVFRDVVSICLPHHHLSYHHLHHPRLSYLLLLHHHHSHPHYLPLVLGRMVG